MKDLIEYIISVLAAVLFALFVLGVFSFLTGCSSKPTWGHYSQMNNGNETGHGER